MTVDAEQAAAAVASVFSDPTTRHQATQVAGTQLWSVASYEDAGDMPLAGALMLVGPDARGWSFSFNPAIHDRNLTVSVLDAIYREGVVAAVEQEALAEAIRTATEVRTRQAAQILAAAAAGALRVKPSRTLP